MSNQTVALNKRQLQAKESKKKIFASAISLFRQRDYDAVTIDDIMELAGLSKGSFYTYFTSKESILVEQFREIDQAYKRAFENLPASASGRERLLLLVDTMTDYCVNECGVEILKVVYASQISRSKSVRILNSKNRLLYRYTRTALRKGIERGEFKEDLPLSIAVEWFVRSARGLIYDWCLYDGSFNLKKEGHAYFSEIITLISV